LTLCPVVQVCQDKRFILVGRQLLSLELDPLKTIDLLSGQRWQAPADLNTVWFCGKGTDKDHHASVPSGDLDMFVPAAMEKVPRGSGHRTLFPFTF